jgi:hypothetical protein
MRLSFYPILQYDMGEGLGDLVPQPDYPPLPDIVLDPDPNPGTGADTPPIVSSSYNPGPLPANSPTPLDDTPTFSKVQYYKIDLYNTKTNLYGESTEKWYYPPYTLDCNVERSEISFTDTEYGVDENQTCTLYVKHISLINLDITPEVGDIFIEVGRYFEVNGVNRILIADPNLGFQTDGSPIYIVSYAITGYLTRTSKLNLIKYSS